MIRNWLIYVATIITLTIFSILYIKESGVVVLVMVAIVPLLYSAITYFSSKRGITVAFGEEMLTVARDEKAVITVVVTNQSELNRGCVADVCLLIQNSMGQRVDELKKRVELVEKETEVCFYYQPRYSGINEVCIQAVGVYSGFSLLKREFSTEEKLSFLIMPEYKEFPIYPELSKIEREGDSNRFSRLKVGNDPSELFDIRQYRPGDKINRINWKFTLKNNDLMVQDFGFPIACDTAIFVDICKCKDPERLERLIEMLYYLAVRMVLEERLFYVIWKDSETGCAMRRMIQSEEDVFVLFTEVFRSNHMAIDTSLEDMYEAQYEGEFLFETIYLYTGRTDLKEEIVQEKLHTACLEFIKV